MLHPSSLFPLTVPAEADLRQELYEMFHGGPFEIPKAHKVILRRARRDDSGAIIPCSCVDPLTKEPDQDNRCPFCLGLGCMWDEEWVHTRKVVVRGDTGALTRQDRHLPPGILNAPACVFYLKYEVMPTYYDRIIEPVLKEDGSVKTPYVRRKVYKPHTLVDHRSDNGRIEYWALYCAENEAILIEESYLK